MTNALAVHDLGVRYGPGVAALHGVTLEVPDGVCVGVLGPNGAGKTSLLRAISGLLDAQAGRITTGSVALFGRDVTRWPSHRRFGLGLAQVMEGRRILPRFTVEENLRAGSLSAGREESRARVQEVGELFPVLRERGEERAGLLSGGQQQMLAIGRALMSGPRLLLLDEPSLGLAPAAIEVIGEALERLLARGVTALIVEQNAGLVLRLCSVAHVLERGELASSGPPERLFASGELAARYLGGGGRQPSGERLRTEPRMTR